MTHTYLHGALFECEDCGDEYEDHPLAFAPHLCSRCEEDVESEAIELGFVEEPAGEPNCPAHEQEKKT